MTRICLGCGETYETNHTAQYCDSCKKEGVKFTCADCGTPSSISWETHRQRKRRADPKPLRCPTCYKKYASALNDETNHKFGSITVIRIVDSLGGGAARWLCRCECGWEHEYDGNYLRKYKQNFVCNHKKGTKSR